MGEPLYRIVNNYRQQLDVLSAVDLDPDTLRDTLEGMQGDLEEKLRAVVAMARQFELEGELRAAEAKRMADGARVLSNKAEALLAYAQQAIQATGIGLPLRAPEFTISLARKPPSLIVDDEALVPQAFKRHIPESWEVDKTLIKEAIKGGAKVTGCRMSDPSYRLAVK